MPATWPLNAANAITLGRIGLFIMFGVAAWRDQRVAAIAFFAAAWLLDAFDGWLARRLHQETTAGYLLDKAVDRLVIIGGVLILIAAHYLPGWSLWLLAKDAAALPGFLLQARSSNLAVGLGWLGKLATVCQGLAIVWLLVGAPYPEAVVAVTALGGGSIGLRHLHKVLRELSSKLSTSG